jgi:hypothetical protein
MSNKMVLGQKVLTAASTFAGLSVFGVSELNNEMTLTSYHNECALNIHQFPSMLVSATNDSRSILQYEPASIVHQLVRTRIDLPQARATFENQVSSNVVD